MAIEIIDEDMGFEEITDKINSLNRLSVEAGYTQASGSVEGFKIVDLAITQELGNDNIPSRPFVRLSFDNNIDEIADTGENLLVSFLDDKVDLELALNIWGDSYRSLLQNGVITRSLGLEENAQSTIDRKGSDTPLIDTGRMIDAVEVNVG